MTAEATAGVAPDIAGLPSWTLDEAQLGDLELLLTGAFAPLGGYLSAAEAQRVTDLGLLDDGTPWPIPVVLDVPGSAVPADARRLALLDPEGTPLAVLDIAGRAPAGPDGAGGSRRRAPGRPRTPPAARRGAGAAPGTGRAPARGWR